MWKFIGTSLFMPFLLASCISIEAENGSANGTPDSGTTEGPASDAAAPSPARIPVEVAELVREDVTDVLDLTGTARPWDEFEVSSEVAGKVVRISVEQGDWVRKDEFLLELDREKRLIELQSRKVQLAKANVELEFARKRLSRAEALLAKGAISQSEVDAIDQVVQVAETSVRISEIAIDSLMEEIGDTRVLSPVEGQISRRHISLGETASPSSPLFTLIQIDPLKVVTEISEPYLHQVRSGQQVELLFEAISEKPLTGILDFIQPVANPQSGAFPAEIRLVNPRRRIQPGMVARIRIEARKFGEVLVAPLDAVVELQGGTFVFVVEDGVAYKRPVEIERRIGSRAIVKGPLSAGDRLVTRGNLNITDGAPVEVVS